MSGINDETINDLNAMMRTIEEKYHAIQIVNVKKIYKV